MRDHRSNSQKPTGLWWHKLVITMLAATVGAGTAEADTVICTARVLQIGISANGTVVPSLEGLGWPYICNLNTNHATSQGPIPPAQRQALLSNLMTAKASGKTVNLYLAYPAAAPSCNALTNFSWQVPAVYPYFISFD